METKPTNPKDAIGSSKLPLHLWPETASALGAVALLDGALKYGRSNWRTSGVRASIYFDAARRHLNAWFEGENLDPDSGVPHLGHVLACVAILVDAAAADQLNDDRMVPGGYRALLDALTPEVARLKELHASKAPKHFTIADTVLAKDAETVMVRGVLVGINDLAAAPQAAALQAMYSRCNVSGGCENPALCAKAGACQG